MNKERNEIGHERACEFSDFATNPTWTLFYFFSFFVFYLYWGENVEFYWIYCELFTQGLSLYQVEL